MLPRKLLLSYILGAACLTLARGQHDVHPDILERLEALEDLAKVQQSRLDEQSKLIASQQDGFAEQQSKIAEQQSKIAEQQSRIERLESAVAKAKTQIPGQSEVKNDQYPSDVIQSKGRQNQYRGSFVYSKTRKIQGPPSSFISWTANSGKTPSSPLQRHVVRDQREIETPAVKSYQTNKRFLTENSNPVAFHAINNQNDTTHVGLHQEISFETVQLNLGGGYNKRHGVFTAPVAGVYIFSTSIQSYTRNHTEIEVNVVKNGVIIARAYAHGTSSSPDQGSVTVATQLNIGDEMWVSLNFPADATYWGNGFTSFMGCLVYPF